ncbi:polysaccharide deacetylase family protein [Phototrophicus methaneseepsis]|uniref:Polysaccharide deacetylase family protein n=1 Tax=Phototrophicus methaneseepsis TaxID=2710758 RepID=A0A7S8IDW9_9CHLR|nr:polysaccharide deacetylase family protein [Phototrophicus methaneseepsis]QPC81253.1 polysaccharide deacetylase family protein [Phototrophicus methaneseepsis]
MRNICILGIFLLLTTITAETQDKRIYQTDGTLRRIYTPILMYHYISELPPEADDIRIGLTVLPHQFADHMAYLRDQNYQTISMDQLDEALRYGVSLPQNPIILTFDDGYIDHYTAATPILKQNGFQGIFYVITAFADNNLPGYMNWQQINDIAADGMWIGSHTKNHVELTDRSYDYLVYEILGSLESIEQHTGNYPTTFSYPIGRYDETTLDVVDTTEIKRSVTTFPGAYHTTDNRHEVSRLRVTSDMEAAGLDQMLRFYRDLR